MEYLCICVCVCIYVCVYIYIHISTAGKRFFDELRASMFSSAFLFRIVFVFVCACVGTFYTRLPRGVQYTHTYMCADIVAMV